MQKGSCATKILGKERMLTLNTQREQEGFVKDIFFNFVMTYIYAQPKRIYEVDAIRAFYGQYNLEESDWEEDSAIKEWRRYKKKVLASSPILPTKIKEPKKRHSKQVFCQILYLFA